MPRKIEQIEITPLNWINNIYDNLLISEAELPYKCKFWSVYKTSLKQLGFSIYCSDTVWFIKFTHIITNLAENIIKKRDYYYNFYLLKFIQKNPRKIILKSIIMDSDSLIKNICCPDILYEICLQRIESRVCDFNLNMDHGFMYSKQQLKNIYSDKFIVACYNLQKKLNKMNLQKIHKIHNCYKNLELYYNIINNLCI